MRRTKCFITISNAFLIIFTGLFSLDCAANQRMSTDTIQTTADLSDTVIQLSDSNTLFYEVRKINNKAIVNSSYSTRKRSFKHSFNMSPTAITHQIPSQAVTIQVGIFKYHKADLFGLGDSVYKLTGKLTLVADASKSYKINGITNERYSLIWIEDQKSGLIVSDVIPSASATAEDIQQVIAEKKQQHETRLKKEATQASEDKELLNQALDFYNAGYCGAEVTPQNPHSVYSYAKSLFENKHHTEALVCFLSIAKHNNVPAETFKYLGLMYDVGFGTEANEEKANYWLEKYKSTDHPVIGGTAHR